MSAVTDRRRYWLRASHDDPKDGPFTLDAALRFIRKADGYSGTSLYRLKGTKEWLLLRSFAVREFGDPNFNRLDQMREAGITRVEWLSTGLPDECAACTKMNQQAFNINDLPEMPPPIALASFGVGASL